MKSKLLWAILLTCFNPKANARQWSKAREVLNKRCVVCHGCYDAPCQLKMESYMGLRRGAHKLRVYDGDTRLQDATPTRLDIDAVTVKKRMATARILSCST